MRPDKGDFGYLFIYVYIFCCVLYYFVVLLCVCMCACARACVCVCVARACVLDKFYWYIFFTLFNITLSLPRYGFKIEEQSGERKKNSVKLYLWVGTELRALCRGNTQVRPLCTWWVREGLHQYNCCILRFYHFVSCV